MITIYALISKIEVQKDFFVDEVVYVGMTKNLKRRLREHKEKEFYKCTVLDQCETKEHAKELEDYYIKLFNPKLNKCLNYLGEYGKMQDIIKSYNIDNFGLFCEILIESDVKPVFKDNYSKIEMDRVYKRYNDFRGLYK